MENDSNNSHESSLLRSFDTDMENHSIISSESSVNCYWSPWTGNEIPIAELEERVRELQEYLCTLTEIIEDWPMLEEEEHQQKRESFMANLKEKADEERFGHEDQLVPLRKLRDDLTKEIDTICAEHNLPNLAPPPN